MSIRVFFTIAAILFLTVISFSASAKVVQTIESFSNEYQWINVKQCKRPAAKAPARIWIDAPSKSKIKSKKISIRRWADKDGDGICEIYDVEDMEKEDFTGKLDDYPMRTTRYENRKWIVKTDWSALWVPLILLDKVTGERLEVPYRFGLAGITKLPMRRGNGFEGTCEALRVNLAIGHMLLFHFPEFAKKDPVMAPGNIWNDYASGWMRSEFWAIGEEELSRVPDDCVEKYRLVIDVLKKERGF